MKTVIIGNSGSGKTWLASRLNAHVDTPVVHLDDIFWEPGGFDRKRSSDAVDQLITENVIRPAWIAEGVFGELAKRFLGTAETLIWLDMNWELCRFRLTHRGTVSKMHLGREQTAEGLGELIDWASGYYERQNMRSHTGHQHLIDNFTGAKVILNSEHDVSQYLNSVTRGGK